jgi:cbb3-type cytochrome oxidase maturation protein
MNMIYLLIGISILLALIFLAAFFWAMKSGQNDDTYTPAIRMLFDDKLPEDDLEKCDEDHL